MFYQYYKLGLLVLFCLVVYACQQQPKLYKKDFSTAEKAKLATQFFHGCGNYYQGSAPEQFILEEGITLDPNNVMVAREIGVPYLKRGFAAEFERYYKRTIDLDAKEWQGWRGYLYLYFYRDYERAIADFDATDTLTPNFVDYPQATSVHFMRAISYLKLKKYEEALTYLDKHLQEELRTTTEDYIDSKTFLYQGIAHYEQSDLGKATASFKRGTDAAPYNADLWYWTAKILLEKGDMENALLALEEGEKQYQKGYQNQRPYVEEFFQLYQSDFDELREKINFEINAPQ